MKAECTCLCAYGFFPPVEGGLPIAASGQAFSSEGTCIFARGRSWGLLRCHYFGQNALASLHSITQLHADMRRLRKNNVCTRSKLDQTYALSTQKLFARLMIEYDPPRQQAGNLLKDNGHAIAFHGHGVLLVGVRRVWRHGIAEFAFFVNRALDHASDGRPIHVDVKDI